MPNNPKIVNTPKLLSGIIPSITPIPQVNTTSTTTPVTATIPVNNSTPPSSEEIAKANVRIKIVRYLDDGRQTLGIMQVYNEDGSEKFELKTVELPYLGNANNISCIPTGKYLIRPRKNDHYGKHFFLIGQEANNYKFNKLIGNGYTRGAVLIHRGPNSTWLAGCIGPGTKFNSRVKGKLIKDKYGAGGSAGNVQGNPYGMISTKDSELAMSKLTNVLWNTPVKDHQFYMIIENASSLTSKASPEVLSKLGISPTIGV
jgi:hypothetical protein